LRWRQCWRDRASARRRNEEEKVASWSLVGTEGIGGSGGTRHGGDTGAAAVAVWRTSPCYVGDKTREGRR
jgi:hypothetical protein